MVESCVTFKATVNGLVIVLDEESDFETIYKQIEKKVSQAGRFFKGASLNVKYRGKKLSRFEEEKIFELLRTKTEADIKSINEDTEINSEEQSIRSAQQKKLKIKKFFFKGIDEGMTKYHRGTIRAGQLVSFDGNIVIIGDVNPSGEIIATGNVIVMGSLRGIVHAGADGNKEAIVAALNLQPTQLRIADVYTRCPDEKEVKGSYFPELAYIKDDSVYIEHFLAQYK